MFCRILEWASLGVASLHFESFNLVQVATLSLALHPSRTAMGIFWSMSHAPCLPRYSFFSRPGRLFESGAASICGRLVGGGNNKKLSIGRGLRHKCSTQKPRKNRGVPGIDLSTSGFRTVEKRSERALSKNTPARPFTKVPVSSSHKNSTAQCKAKTFRGSTPLLEL